jgi:hypothetical protein
MISYSPATLSRSATALLGSLFFLLAVALLTSATAQATPIYDTFGPLDGATFGGTGIPTTEVAISSQFYDGDVEIIVAMSATQRYTNPVVTNDGAGTYFATTGSNFGGAGQSATLGALWNFNYYMKVVGSNGATPKLTDYQFDLYYDFEPGLDTLPGALGVINVTAALGASTATLVEGSENLLFGFLAAPIFGVVSPPAGAFDPNALGEYNFGIQVRKSGWGVESVAMDVQVVPEPSSLLLSTLALGAVAWRRRR